VIVPARKASEMIKVFLYGVISENNLGGPSLMHGVREIMDSLYDDYEIVCFQGTKVVDSAISDMGFSVYENPYKKALSMLTDAVKFKMGKALKQKDCGAFFKHLQTSDIVANLFGICFCSSFAKGRYTYLKARKMVIGTFLISIIAKLYGKRTVKCPSSYGPIKSQNDLVAARFAAKHIFDVMCAREIESERQMRDVAGIKCKIIISPDMGNLMPYVPAKNKCEKLVGISVSHQIIKQWKSNEPYICCIGNLIDHILKTKGCKVVLIPNEVSFGLRYHDAHVADEILNRLVCNRNVSILDVSRMNSSQVKTVIGRCELMIASRYHSCVAALSAGVPTLVVGWHYKYEELLKLYGQGKWIISSQNCTSKKLIKNFEELWDKRVSERRVIGEKYYQVRKQVIKAGKVMFLKEVIP